MDQLVSMLQAVQKNPVPYRPNLVELVERFNRTWKDMISAYVNQHQTDWDVWLSAVIYAYNSAKHTSTGYAPYELMYEREARLPGDLLRIDRRRSLVTMQDWHRNLQSRLEESHALARQAIAKERTIEASKSVQQEIQTYQKHTSRHVGLDICPNCDWWEIESSVDWTSQGDQRGWI